MLTVLESRKPKDFSLPGQLQGALQQEGSAVPARECDRGDFQCCLRPRVQPHRARVDVAQVEVAVQEGEDGPHPGGAHTKLREDDQTHSVGLPGREDLQHLRG